MFQAWSRYKIKNIEGDYWLHITGCCVSLGLWPCVTSDPSAGRQQEPSGPGSQKERAKTGPLPKSKVPWIQIQIDDQKLGLVHIT